jgi:peptidoglycan/xylan/chitin deacetylase (PgdA/CDA1 family)
LTKHIATDVLFIVALSCLGILHLHCHIAYGWFALWILLYMIVNALGSYFIQLNFFTYSYCKGNSDKKQIAITFDDGPNEYTERILDILKSEKATATFFCIGKNISGNERILSRTDEEGHLIGNHSFRHKVSFPMQSKQSIANEINQCSEAITATIHKKTKLFRPPFGVTNPMVAAGIKLTGMYSIGWNVRSYDTVVASPDKLLQKVNVVSNGDIILFHEAGKQTAAVLSQFIKNVRSQGFEIIPLDQLLGIDVNEK